MKVLHLLAERGFSGGEVQLRYLIRHLVERGHENELVLVEGAAFHRVAEEFGLKVHHVNLRRPTSVSMWYRLPRVVRKSRPDVLHYGCGRSLLYGGLATLHLTVPAKITTRRIDYPIGPGLRGMRYRRFVNHVAANCQSVYDRVRSAGVPKERVTLVHEGVETKFWSGLREHREVARIRLDIPQQAVVVAQAATLGPRKGQAYLMRAFAHLAHEFPRSILVLAGDGRDKDKLQRLAIELGIQSRVRLPGAIRPVQDLYAATDVFCMNSFHEGLSNACLEASAAGLPQVVSKVGGLPEIVEDGVTGLVVPPGDVDRFTEGLRSFLRDEQLRLEAGIAGAERISSMFTAEKMAQGMERLFLEVLNRN